MAGTLVANTINTDTGLFSTNNAYSGIAKAWVAFTVSGTTPTIQNQFNISSVTRVSTGVYTITFTTAMPNANYIEVICNVINNINNYNVIGLANYQASSPYYTAPTTTSFNAGWQYNGTSYEPQYGYIAVFGN